MIYFQVLLFAPLQGGLILYNNTDQMKAWLKKLKVKFVEKNFFDDQFSIREMLWESTISFYILPPEYNFNSIDDLKKWRKNHYREAIPKIFHYTKNKNKNITSIVKKYYSSYNNDWQNLDRKFKWLPDNIRKKLKKIKKVIEL